MLCSLLLAAAALPSPQEAVRVACLGDSITYGAQVADREHNAYPVQLAQRLDQWPDQGRFEVRNFGVGGRTLLRAGDQPYSETDAWHAALDWAPDVAVVMLGTNDTCQNGGRRNWERAEGLEESARALALDLREANPKVRVLLCSPPPMFADAPGLDDARRANLAVRAPRLERVRDALRDVAAGLPGVEHCDLARALTVGHVVDGVHTTPFGAEALAHRLAESLLAPQAPPIDFAAALAAEGIAAEESHFHGFPRVDFALAESGARCTIVAPHVTAADRPWIWRARFFGHQPALELELLDRGFHVAFCDVAHLYGAPAAVERWERFHALARRLGLGARPVLEGMSRGGLAILNYALAHPTAVAAVYGDNPVCDVRSWPGGRSGKRSDEDWARCLAAWGLTEQAAWEFAGPLAELAPLAEARVPLLLVVGTADEVVPPSENAEPLASRYVALGGPVHVWRKPGLGHHPHGLAPPGPLRRALQRAAGQDTNPATRATPSAEHRGHPAGWGGGTWWDQLAALRALAGENDDAPVVFLGDSISQGLTGAGDRLARPGGARAVDRYHGERGALSLGLSGDRTEHLLYRIEHGALAVCDPRVIVLQIGVNNVNSAGHTGEETAAGIVAVVDLLRAREPQAHVLVCGPFPLGAPGEQRRAEIDLVHAGLRVLEGRERVHVRDLRPLFLDEEARANERMGRDLVHLAPAGYEAWLEALEPLVAELVN